MLPVMLAGVGVLLSAALAGCGGKATPPGGARNPYPFLRQLQADPAAALVMPGAEELGRGAQERYQTLQGYRPPSSTVVYGTQASREEVYAFYDRELRARGYVFVPGGADRGSVEEVAWLWCKPGAEFRLAIKEQDRAYAPSFYRGQQFRTVFEGAVFGRVPGESCP